jgi:hypothetical protein
MIARTTVVILGFILVLRTESVFNYFLIYALPDADNLYTRVRAI